MAGGLGGGETTTPAALAWGKAELAAAGFAPIDYLAICDALDLTPVDTLERPARVLTAAWLGKTRLIDNLALEAGWPRCSRSSASPYSPGWSRSRHRQGWAPS